MSTTETNAGETPDMPVDPNAVSITINGRTVAARKGELIINAADREGEFIPRFCYHPRMSPVGMCRQCMVEVEGPRGPMMVVSCMTPVADGQVVRTETEQVKRAQEGMIELLLANHPLDCPVCDKGGECPLQDFSYQFGPANSRMDFPRRVFDGEGVKADVDFGPTLMLNRNRCILCTRCVRFMKEVDGDAQIGVIDRGCGSEIATFSEEGVRTVLSGNLMDVCPVGAITTRDYRFKSRPWDNPNVVDTICTGCSKGCSVSAWLKAKPEWAKGSHLIRMTPRYNPDVNGYWMCDIGRFGYHWVEGDTRLRRPMLRSGASLEPAAWHDVEPKVRDGLRAAGSAVAFLASAHASTEDFFVLGQLAEGLLGADARGAVTVTWTSSVKEQPQRAKFQVPVTDAPNVNGARDLGYDVGAGNQGAPNLSALRDAVGAGRVKALYVVSPGPDGSLGDVAWILAAKRSGTLPLLIVQSTVMTELAAAADIVLPGTSYVEKDGLFTNDQGHVQATSPSVPPPGEARDDWQILANVASSLGIALSFATVADIRKALTSAGWKEKVTTDDGMIGLIDFEKGEQTISLKYVDPGFIPAEVTINGSGVELEKVGK